MRLLAIDPGNRESAYVVIDQHRHPLDFNKISNEALLRRIYSAEFQLCNAKIEMVASYGMAVGADVFETCVWIGRFYEALVSEHSPVELIKRHPVKMHHCHSAKAKDSNIRQALVDRFAPGMPNYGKGTKAEPGWFYGFHDDVWQAYALAVYAMDVREGVTA